ncbi:MAG: hypothetical protein U9P14_04540 [Gemmatimonadota bacterium]|nr:hypothetical protein [Gemmatimonadota bacterium]
MKIYVETLPRDRYYIDRESRARFITDCFFHTLREPLLDIGCDRQYLRQYLPDGFKYMGLDITGSADVRCNLDQGYLPIKPNSFASVVCTDVLEHLENIHLVFEELFNISTRYIILSLPNAWNHLLSAMVKGRVDGDKYGLPVSAPSDRHRWFFNCTEAKQFLIENIACRAKSVTFYYYYGYVKRGIILKTARVLLPSSRFDNFFTNTLWVIIEK